MVSNASEDLPEPDRPVNTTSLSRGISRSTFFRLCSRGPRMVIARVPEPEFCCRLALMISSMSAVPDAHAYEGAPAEQNFRNGRQWVHSERRKNVGRFPVPRENHQRFVAKCAAGLRKWQQMARAGRVKCAARARNEQNGAIKKAGARPAFSQMSALRLKSISVLRDHRATPAVVQADGDEVD